MWDSEREEIADLIVEGESRKAYEKLRDYWQLNTYDQRRRMLDARNAPQAGPSPTEAEIDAIHDRALRSFKTKPANSGKPDRAHGVVTRPAGAPRERTEQA